MFSAPPRYFLSQWFLPVVILIVICLVATACSGEESTDNDGTSTEAGESTAEVDELHLPLGTTHKIGDAEVTANSCRVATSDVFPPDPGNRYIVIDVTVVNTGDDAYNISSILQTDVRDADGRVYSVTVGPETSGTLDGTIPAGDMLRGEAAFEVPEAATLQFQFKQALGDDLARWDLTTCA